MIMKIRDSLRKTMYRAEAVFRNNWKRIAIVYLLVIAAIYSAMYFYWRSEFSWNEIQCMSNLKILFEDYGLIASWITDDTMPDYSIVQISRYQTLSASFYHSEEQKMYPIDFTAEQSMLHVTIKDEKAYELKEFNEEVTADFYAWDALDKSSHRLDGGSQEVKELRKLTMPSENTQVIPIGKTGYLIVSSESDPLMPALVSLLLWHVMFLILYVFYRYIVWARKTILSEKEKVRVMRRDMMNAIAHEIRTPLSAIMGYTENLKLGIREDKKDWYLERITEKSNQIDHMIDDILSLAKLEETGTLHRDQLLLSEILESCMADYPDVQFAYQKKQEYKVTCDGEYITRMFRCLLDNAVKYREEGTPVSVYIDTNDVRIHNICEPLDEDKLKDLFDFHANRDGRYSFGLYFASKAAEKNGMKLRIYNENDGVTVQIS